MQKIIVSIFCLLGLSFFCRGQLVQEEIKNRSPSGKMNVVSAGPTVPVGNFSNTHFIGFSADYFRSNRKFGKIKKLPAEPLGLIAGAGASYYPGKKESVATYSYRYSGYLHLFIQGGFICSPTKYGNIILTAGPGIGFYNKTTRFIISTSLHTSFQITDKISISPAISLLKEHGADPLWSASLKTSLAF